MFMFIIRFICSNNLHILTHLVVLPSQVMVSVSLLHTTVLEPAEIQSQKKSAVYGMEYHMTMDQDVKYVMVCIIQTVSTYIYTMIIVHMLFGLQVFVTLSSDKLLANLATSYPILTSLASVISWMVYTRIPLPLQY